MMVAMTVSVLIAMIWQNYPANWRLAPNTAVILMAAALHGTGLPEEVRLAMYRVMEVVTGKRRRALANRGLRRTCWTAGARPDAGSLSSLLVSTPAYARGVKRAPDALARQRHLQTVEFLVRRRRAPVRRSPR